MLSLVLQGVLLGIGATALMDLWAILLHRAIGQPRPNWAMVGRWFWNLRSGTVFHRDIALAPPHPRELAIGWAAHYAVGIAYGIAFALIAGPAWFVAPRLLPAWIFGIVTIGFGWFLLHPGLGLGWAASRTTNPAKARVFGLAAHSVFGLGLWLTALLLA